MSDQDTADTLTDGAELLGRIVKGKKLSKSENNDLADFIVDLHLLSKRFNQHRANLPAEPVAPMPAPGTHTL